MTDRRAPLPLIRDAAVAQGRTAGLFAYLIRDDLHARMNQAPWLTAEDRSELLALLEAMRIVGAAAISANGNAEDTPPDLSRTLVGDDLVNVEEAAAMLGVTPRRVRQIAGFEIDGRKVSGVWRLDRADVEALAADRRARENQ